MDSEAAWQLSAMGRSRLPSEVPAVSWLMGGACFRASLFSAGAGRLGRAPGVCGARAGPALRRRRRSAPQGPARPRPPLVAAAPRRLRGGHGASSARERGERARPRRRHPGPCGTSQFPCEAGIAVRQARSAVAGGGWRCSPGGRCVCSLRASAALSYFGR